MNGFNLARRNTIGSKGHAVPGWKETLSATELWGHERSTEDFEGSLPI